jgi:hypothetical protein
MAPTTRTGSPVKGKGRAEEEDVSTLEARSFYQEPDLGEGSPSLDLQANLLALQQAQVKQQLENQRQKKQLENQEKQLHDIQQSIAGLVALFPPQTQTGREGSATVLPAREFSQLIDNQRTGQAAPLRDNERPSVAPSSSSQGNPNYKPKVKDPLRFSGHKGLIRYTAWKELILDKFETDHEQFPSIRSHMTYIFNCTKGEAQDHLYPRYTRNADNLDPYASYHDMFATLDIVYVNHHLVRDSRSEYRELKMGTTEAFQDFKTQFIHLANAGKIPLADRFDDMYDKMTTALQGQLLNQRHLLGEDFEKLCEVASGIDVELKRLNIRRNKEREARVPKPSSRAQNTPFTARNPATPEPRTSKDTSAGFSLLQRPALIGPLKAPAATPNQTLPPVKYFNCGEASHWVKDCTKPKRAPAVNDIEEDEVAEFEPIVGDSEDQDQGNVDA